MADHLLRSLWAEPAIENPPPRTWRDWALVGLCLATAGLEFVVRNDIAWPAMSAVLIGPTLLTLPWRRAHPFPVLALAFGSVTVATVAGLIGGANGTIGLYTMAAVLLLPYAQFRWGSGRRAAAALTIMVVAATTGLLEEYTGIADAIGGCLILLFPAVVGVEVRHLRGSRQRELDDVKLREREQIARELHDTVAHHVSAIVIQAQAGRTVAATRPGAALDALQSIEGEASRTLNEMRSIVGSLRHGAAALTPQPRTCDITRLAENAPGPVSVDVRFTGDVSGLPLAVDTAVYRLAQEAITNARRHARHATSIDVSIDANDDAVTLTVRDDGRSHSKRRGLGFGLVGMGERVALLGGTLHAGPEAHGGWTVVADLPLGGARS